MATLDAQVEASLGPFRTAVELIVSTPGIKNLGAHVIVSEIGIDMSRFAFACRSARLASLAGLVSPAISASIMARPSGRFTADSDKGPSDSSGRDQRI